MQGGFYCPVTLGLWEAIGRIPECSLTKSVNRIWANFERPLFLDVSVWLNVFLVDSKQYSNVLQVGLFILNFLSSVLVHWSSLLGMCAYKMTLSSPSLAEICKSTHVTLCWLIQVLLECAIFTLTTTNMYILYTMSPQNHEKEWFWPPKNQVTIKPCKDVGFGGPW